MVPGEVMDGVARAAGQGATAGVALIAAGAGVAFGSSGNVFISVWRGANTAENLAMQGKHLAEFARHHKGNSGFLCVIEQDSPVPNQKMRQMHTEILRELGDDLTCIGCVIEGGSMRASVVRSVLVGISLLQRTEQPTSYFGDPSVAHRWMQSRMDTGTTAAAVDSAVDAIRAAIR